MPIFLLTPCWHWAFYNTHINPDSQQGKHIYTEIGTNLSVSKIQAGPMVSDHHFIFTSLSIKKPPVKKDQVMIRKISAITADQLCQEFSDKDMLNTEDLDSLVDKFDTELTRVMDMLASEKEVVISSHNPGMTKQSKTSTKLSEIGREFGANINLHQTG